MLLFPPARIEHKLSTRNTRDDILIFLQLSLLFDIATEVSWDSWRRLPTPPDKNTICRFAFRINVFNRCFAYLFGELHDYVHFGYTGLKRHHNTDS